MSSIQGVSSATPPIPPQIQKVATAAVAKDKDHDGDVDKAGPADNDKGKNLDIKA